MRVPESSERGDKAGRQRPANMGDVARLAGVSHQTVSRVLNEAVNVSPPTRKRVLAAMKKLDYRPNPAAKSLVTGHSRSLGVVSFNTTLFGPASTLAGIEQAAREVHYSVTMASLEAVDRKSVIEAIERLRDQRVAGIAVVAPTVATLEALQSVPTRTPLVAVEGDPYLDIPVVAVDQLLGGREVTQHLLELGHSSIWHVRGPEHWLEATGRFHGWQEALKEAGITPPRTIPTGDWSPASGYRAGLELAGRKDVTAVFVANDQMAIGVMRALQESGRKVPGDISVVGFDDIPESAYLTPPLTTVRQPFDEVGRRCVRILLDQIEAGERIQRREIVRPQLITRQSSVAPARAKRASRR